MALASINESIFTNRPGNIFLFDYPLTNPGAGTTIAQVEKGYWGLMYADGDVKGALKGGVAAWGNVGESGFKLDIKGEPLTAKNSRGVEITAKYYKSIKGEGEFTFLDVDVDHLKDIVAGSLNPVAKTVTIDGQSTKHIGGDLAVKQYVLVYQMPSVKVAGSFDHILIPRAMITLDMSAEYSAGKHMELKVKVSAQPDTYLKEANGNGVLVGMHESTTLKS